MIKDENRHLIGKARLLRRQGKTYNEIRDALGVPISSEKLRVWLRGIPRPPETYRTGMGDPALRRKARQLRADGMTIREIAAALGIVSTGSVAPWIHAVKFSPRQTSRRSQRVSITRGKGGAVLHQRAVERSAQRAEAAQHRVGPLSKRELLLVGAGLYWAEGKKDKPWRRDGRVTLVNSDLSIIQVFLAWLAAMGVETDRRRFRLNIHESADVSEHEQWWADQIGVPRAEFQRPTLKRHNPKTVRHNQGESYYGCLVVSVTRGRELYDMIDGMWKAITLGSLQVETMR